MGLSGDEGHRATGTPAQRVQDYLRAVRRRWLLVVALTAIAAAAAVGLASRQQKQYSATSKVMVERVNPVNTLLDNGASAYSNDPERDINTGIQMIKLDDVAHRVQARLGGGESTNALLAQVSTAADGTSDLVDITVTDPDPARAARIADVWAQEYVGYRRDTARAPYLSAAQLAQRHLNALSPAARQGSEGRALESRLQELQIASALQTGGAHVVDTAAVPTAPTSPKPVTDGVLAGVLGLIVAIAIALVLESVDRRIRDESEAESELGVPMIAAIPRPRRTRSSEAVHAQEEAYTTLATNLRFLGSGGSGVQTVLITSAGPSEGKTSITLGLARSLAMLRRRVIAIEADLRRPTFAEYLELQQHGGLAAALAGFGDVQDELIEIDAITGERVDRADAADGSDVFSYGVLPAGRVLANPHRILSSAKMREIVAEARSVADFVLIDTPPVGTVTDALSLASSVDAALVAVRLNKTRRDGARRTLRLLENVGVEVPGLVVTGVAPGSTTEYDYYPVEREQERRRVVPLRRKRAAAG